MALLDLFTYAFTNLIKVDIFIYVACAGFLCGAFGFIVSLVKGKKSLD